MLPWIKITTDLPDKWQVLAVRRALKVRTAYEVVGMLVKLWSHFEGHTENGKLPGLVPDDIDRLIGRKGFALALVQVGWLKFHDGGGVEVPAYDEYMGAAARKREEETERKRLQRERDAAGTVAEPAPAQAGQPAVREPDATGTDGGTPPGQSPDTNGTSAGQVRDNGRDKVGTEPGPKRERKKEIQKENRLVAALPDAGAGGAASEPGAGTVADPKAVVLPANLESPEFRAAWGDWIAQRRAKKIKAYTPEGAQALLHKLAEHGPAAAVAAIRESVAQGWQGLFPERHVPRAGPVPASVPASAPSAHRETPEELVARLRREKAPKPASAPPDTAPVEPPCTSRSPAPTGTPSGSPPTLAPSG